MDVETEGYFSVLLVDDDDMIRQLGAKLLERLGYRVFVLSSGAEALEFCRSGKQRPDCLLLDLNMHGMSGDETLTAIRELLPDIPAIVASGQDISTLPLRDTNSPWNGHLQKPFRLSNLATALESVRKEN